MADDEEMPLSPQEPERDCCTQCRAVFRFLYGWTGVADLAFSTWYLSKAVDSCESHAVHGFAVVLGIMNLSALLLHILLAFIFHPFAFGLSNSIVYIAKCFARCCCPSLTIFDCWATCDATTKSRKASGKLDCCRALGDVSEDLDRRLDKPVEAAIALLGGSLFAAFRAAVVLNLIIRFFVLDVAVVVAAVMVLLQYFHFVCMQICYCGAMRTLGMSCCGAFFFGCIFGILIIYVFPIGMSYLLWKYDNLGEELCH